jgi:transcriptional regulator with XRE-family HTH domain
MAFSKTLSDLRKQLHLTQRDLSERAGISLMQIKNYEAGRSQPTLDAIKSLATVLNASADQLIFDDPPEESQELKLQRLIKVITTYSDEEQKTIESLLDAYIKKHRLEEMVSSDS